MGLLGGHDFKPECGKRKDGTFVCVVKDKHGNFAKMVRNPQSETFELESTNDGKTAKQLKDWLQQNFQSKSFGDNV